MNIATDFLVFDNRKETDAERKVSILAHSMGVTGWMTKDSAGNISIHCEASEKALMEFAIALMNELSSCPLRVTSGNFSHCDHFQLPADADQVDVIWERV
jgi:acylphosphatase